MVALKNKFRLIRGLIHGDLAYTGPHYVALDVTRRCNIRCLGCFFHCIQERRPTPGNHGVEELSLEVVQKLCKELPKLGTGEVILLGEGEPLLHPRLTEFITAFKGVGLFVQLFTNGTLLNERKIVQLLESGLDILNVTLWAINEEEHEKLHPGVDLKLLGKRMEALDLFVQTKKLSNTRYPHLNLHMPINRHNYMNIQERIEYIQKCGCDSVSLAFFRDCGGDFEALTLFPEDMERVLPTFIAAKRRFESVGIAHNIDEYLAHALKGYETWREIPCYAGWYQCQIKVDGTVIPCGHCYLEMGNVAHMSLQEIWNGERFRIFRRQGFAIESLKSLAEVCDCANCCHVKDNFKVHRVFKWLSPLMTRKPHRAGLN